MKRSDFDGRRLRLAGTRVGILHRPSLDPMKTPRSESQTTRKNFRTLSLALACLFAFLSFPCRNAFCQTASSENETNGVIAQIRKEGLENSHVAETLSYLSDVIGQRLTGSPSLHRASEWTQRKLAGWGLANAHQEPWGPFGRGWSMERFSAQIIEPYNITLIACPNAWSSALDQPLTANVIYIDSATNADQFKGKVAGAIVLAGAPHEVGPRFDPLSSRLSESNLLRLADAAPPPARPAAALGARRGPRPSGARTNRFGDSARLMAFLAKENAGLVVHESFQGDGGTVFVAAATVPGVNRGSEVTTNALRAWSTNAPAMPPQITLAAEDYNRLVRMIKAGEKLKMEVNLQTQFYTNDVMAYNTIAEIPGSDLKDQIVMLGAHLDSWQSGTGATDNGAGVACTMEAMRILSAIKAHPRRTIRIGLWTGEEQGILGSRAYVTEHFGYYTNGAMPAPQARSDRPASANDEPDRNAREEKRKLIRRSEYDRLSAYFNLDNGAGKIRGVYMQGNEAVRPLFRRWLEPFRDLGAETLTISNTGSTDHIPFDAIGLPGFQFIQDSLEYSTRSHHSNEDVYDRIVPEDLKQASTILAAFAWNAAMLDEMLPRKPAE
jgi:hypothetical protein